MHVQARDNQSYLVFLHIAQIGISLHQPVPSGRAVTRLIHLPWSSGHDFRLSLTPISAGDRGSIPRGRVLFCNGFVNTFFFSLSKVFIFCLPLCPRAMQY